MRPLYCVSPFSLCCCRKLASAGIGFFIALLAVSVSLGDASFAFAATKEAVSHKAAKGGKQGKDHKHHHHHHKKTSETARRKHGHSASAKDSKSISARSMTARKKHDEAAQGQAASRSSTAQAAIPPLTEGQASIDGNDKGTATGLPLPRFASLRAERVYMRRGPGERYPIDWVYHRRGLPVKIEREFDLWRLVEDSEGQKGWVHRVTLRGTRGFVIPGASSFTPPSLASQDQSRGQGEEKNKVSAAVHADSQILGYISPQNLPGSSEHDTLLMSSALPDHKVVAVLKPGTVGQIKACPQGSAWCHVTVRGYSGWLERRALWGVQPGEIIQPD